MENMNTSKDEKITEKAFSQGLLVSVLSILLCIVGLCSVTYAWFTTDLSSGENTLESVRFALDITVVDEYGTVIIGKPTDNGKVTYNLSRGSSYTFTLEMTDDAKATKGYCTVLIDGVTKYTTSYISRDESIGHSPFIFTISTDTLNEDVTVTLTPKWGLPASTDIEYMGKIIMGESHDGTDAPTAEPMPEETTDEESDATTEEADDGESDVTTEGDSNIEPEETDEINTQA